MTTQRDEFRTLTQDLIARSTQRPKPWRFRHRDAYLMYRAALAIDELLKVKS